MRTVSAVYHVITAQDTAIGATSFMAVVGTARKLWTQVLAITVKEKRL
jgi:hypothetical protein